VKLCTQYWDYLGLVWCVLLAVLYFAPVGPERAPAMKSFYWDFSDAADGTAEHFLRHLREFLQRRMPDMPRA